MPPDPAFTLTVLGCGPAFPNAGGACSGYLVRTRASTVLIDCGSGVCGRLRQEHDPVQLSGIVISHLHADHYMDLVSLYYGLRYAARADGERPPRIPVHLPKGGRAHLARLGQLVSGQSDMMEQVYLLNEYAPADSLRIGDLTISLRQVQHYIRSHAMRISTDAGPLLVYSADSAPCSQLREAARGADLFLCEAALLNTSADEADPARRGHLTAGEAGAIARQAGVKKLLLTHYRAGREEVAYHRASAAAEFDGPVDLAEEGRTYAIG